MANSVVIGKGGRFPDKFAVLLRCPLCPRALILGGGLLMPFTEGSRALGVLVLFFHAVFIWGCSGQQYAPVDIDGYSYSQQPCWLSNPYSNKAQGIIGISGRYGSPRLDLKKISQYRALQSLADMLGEEPPEREALAGSGPYLIGNQEVALAPVWTEGNYHFSYAYVVDQSRPGWIIEECPRRNCQPESCEPAWLCKDGRDLDYASVVTVSQIAADLPTQYSFFFDNALEQLQAMYGVDVQSYERVIETSNSLRRLGLGYVQESRLKFAEGEDPYLVLANTCQKGTLYYARVMIRGVGRPEVDDRWPPDWHMDLGFYGMGLEIGSFSGYLSRNLLSSKIMKAVEDALVKIARSKQIDITSEEINVQRSEGGGYYGHITQAETDTTIEAEVRSVRFVGDSSSPTIYVLMENTN